MVEIDVARNAERALRMVREAKLLSYDTEGSGLDWRYNSPTGYVIGAPSNGDTIKPEDVVYVPVRHGGGGNILGGKPMEKADDSIVIHDWERELAKAFKERDVDPNCGRTIGHNMKFDVHSSANAGVMLGRKLACTQNQEAMLDEYARSYSLEASAERHGVTAKKGTELYARLAELFGGPADRSSMQHFWRTSGTDPIAYEYATGDGVTTYELYQSQCKDIDDQELNNVSDLENDLIWTVFRMERKGIRIDLDRVDALRIATEDRITEMLRHFPPGFNVRSPVAMKKAMDDAGFTDYPRTLIGNPSFTEKWLKRNELGQKVISIRQASNLINSFVNPLIARHVFKGRVHATLNQMKSDDKGTISGRFSCSDPNLQQIPKRVKEIAKPFRRLFVADPGHKFFEYDWSQAEPRLFAHYSQASELLKGYNSTPFRDMHTVTAELLGVERDPTAKRLGMGILTGMQSKALMGHMNCSIGQAEEWMDRFFSAYPEIKTFQNSAKKRLGSRGWVKTLYGRRCRLEAFKYAYRGTSKIIQGGQADLMKYKLREIDRLCEDEGDIVQILCTVHDAIEGQREDTPEAAALLKEVVRIFEDVRSEPFNLTVPFVAEGGEGADWSEASFGR